jgi:uronate dehydrogenase
MAIKTHNRILLTGAAGGLGKVLRQTLKENCHYLRTSDIADYGPAYEWEEIVRVDLSDEQAMNRLLTDVDAVVHMGGISLDGPFMPIMKANILGAYNLYEAARLNGVKRIVFASSNHVTGFYKQSETINASHPPRPDGHYGLSKAFGEDLSRFYYDRFQIETACVRIGSSFEKPRDRRMLASWLSYQDLHRLITACLTTPVLGHSIVFGVSNNSVVWYDNSQAKHIGYLPLDSSDPFKQSIFDQTSEPDLSNPAHVYQGGAFASAGPYGLK